MSKHRAFELKPATWGTGILLLVAYIAAAELGLELAFPNTNVSPVWPPSGIALAALYLAGLRYWPAVALGAFSINLFYFLKSASLATSLALTGAAMLALGNTLEAVVGAYLLQRFAGHPKPFETLRGVFVFVSLAAMLACMLAATIGVTTTRSLGVTGGSSYLELWLTWWVGDASGVLIVAPVLIAFRQLQWRWPTRQRLAEALLLTVVIVLSSVLVFDSRFHLATQHYPIAYLLLPSVLWAVLRFHVHGVAAALLLIGLIATAGTVHGSGPFTQPTINESLLLLQLFIAMLVCTALSLAAAIAERDTLAQQLQASNGELQRLAFYDGLTGLANRRLFRDRLDQAILTAKRGGQGAALMLLDLDNFKRVNDTLGHDAGDKLLQIAAQRLASCVREGDSVSRFGGDEFTVLLRAIDDAKGAAVVARKMIVSLREPIDLNGHTVTATTSIGITLMPTDGMETQVLMKNADMALYRAKMRGRNTFHFFTDELNQRASQRQRLEVELREALQQQQLCLHYQPVVRLHDRQLVALAAQLCWQHPRRGLLSYDRFGAVAEESGISVELGQWQLQALCQQARKLQQQSPSPLPLAMTMTLPQLCDPVLPNLLETVLTANGSPPLWFKLAASEAVLTEDGTLIAAVLFRLKRLGIHVSIDHFGSAACPLRTLRQLPIDTLQIDHELVAALTTDPDAGEMIDAVVTLAHQMRFTVTADGVATELEARLLQEHGCDWAQGTFIGQPLPAEQLDQLLHAA